MGRNEQHIMSQGTCLHFLLSFLAPLVLGLLFVSGVGAFNAAKPRQGMRHYAADDANSDFYFRVRPALVTGATGRTGSLVYTSLQQLGVPVRALVRNASKARELLHCSKCDESEGIYLGDVTNPDTLVAPMHGVINLVILTSSFPLKLPNGSYFFPDGEFPKDIDWLGSINQVRAALHAGVKHVLLVSSMGTTEPDSFLDQLAHGHVMWYKLNGEAHLMASGLPFTIIKPGGLLNNEGGKSLLLAGHDDNLPNPRVSRADLAAVLVAAIQHPRSSAFLRFDLSSDDTQPATGDFEALFKKARDWASK